MIYVIPSENPNDFPLVLFILYYESATRFFKTSTIYNLSFPLEEGDEVVFRQGLNWLSEAF